MTSQLELDREKRIVSTYLKNPQATLRDVGDAFGVGAETVRRILHRHGQRARNGKWSKDEDEKLREIYATAGETGFLAEAPRALGRTYAAVACRAEELGLTHSRGEWPHGREHVLAMAKAPQQYKAKPLGRRRTRGGFREDIGIYVRSGWEADYARYLNWLKDRGEITGWTYEPDAFEFTAIRRGTRFYIPDFKVAFPDGQVEYHEVKGHMIQKARTALSRMTRYYPDVKVVLIQQAEMAAISKFAALIPGWESGAIYPPRR